MTSDIRTRRYPFTYVQKEYDAAKALLADAEGPCLFGNGHCVHGRQSHFRNSSGSNEQQVGWLYWCCMCPAKHDFRTTERR